MFPEGADTTTRDRVLVQVNSVSEGYFTAIGIPLLKGRDFTRADGPDAPKVVIINERMAQQFWPGEEPLGKRFKFFGQDFFNQVVGVAKDSKYNFIGEDPTPFIYQATTQVYQPQVSLFVRSDNPAAVIGAMAVWAGWRTRPERGTQESLSWRQSAVSTTSASESRSST